MGYTFTPQTTYAVGDTPNSVTTADVNGDGQVDLITANQNSNTVWMGHLTNFRCPVER